MGKALYESQSMWPGDGRQVLQVSLCSAPGGRPSSFPRGWLLASVLAPGEGAGTHTLHCGTPPLPF